ncbi:DEAD/DEAH box helicase [Candidatus Poriferisocius sp.]|uniref:DEAD/DEAH box helicase n=1 Tax=Candidatus Poriferisocius sp. TaxID=3101276 RepID=UPI003B0251C5
MPPTFAQLGVPESICRALERNGIHKPFEIQAAVIADAMEGRDICGRAPTGSGKTLAFGIPLVANTAQARPRRPRALILSPTRELADQIASELRSISGPISVAAVYGGVGYVNQRKQLQKGVDILVACPGRLEDLIDQRAVSLHETDQVVIDEADRMADMGFLPAVRRILDQTNSERQTVMFSATLDKDVAKLTRDYQDRPITHEVGDATPDVRSADHRFWTVEKTERVNVCANVISSAGPTIVFCRTRHGSDRLARQLSQRGVSAAAIHGGHAQNRRTRTLREFTDGRVMALVATDVAARGIHVDCVAGVIHFDPPEDHKAYLHRSGRTARAGETGLVVSLIQQGQHADVKLIQQQLGLNQPITSPTSIEQREAPVRRSKPTQPKGAGQNNRKRSGKNQERRNRPDRDNNRGRKKSNGNSRSQRNQSGRQDNNRGGRNSNGRPQGRPHQQERRKTQSGASSR